MSATDSVCDVCGAGVRPYSTGCERCAEMDPRRTAWLVEQETIDDMAFGIADLLVELRQWEDELASAIAHLLVDLRKREEVA